MNNTIRHKRNQRVRVQLVLCAIHGAVHGQNGTGTSNGFPMFGIAASAAAAGSGQNGEATTSTGFPTSSKGIPPVASMSSWPWTQYTACHESLMNAGDPVMVNGEVGEFFGFTQCGMHVCFPGHTVKQEIITVSQPESKNVKVRKCKEFD